MNTYAVATVWSFSYKSDHLCGLATDPVFRVRFQVLPDFLRSSGSGTVSTQHRKYNWRATWNKRSCSGLEFREYCRGAPLRWLCDTLCLQKLALTSPTSFGHTVSTVRSRTKATELLFVVTRVGCRNAFVQRWIQSVTVTILDII
jgi:hypothetical protein